MSTSKHTFIIGISLLIICAFIMGCLPSKEGGFTCIAAPLINKLKNKTPSSPSSSQTVPGLTSSTLTEMVDESMAETKAQQYRIAAITSLLQSSNIAVLNVLLIEESPNSAVMLVVLDYTKLGTGSAPGYFMTAGQQSLIRIASIKQLDLSGVAYLTVALQDSKGRMFYEVGAKAADVTAFRNGTLNQQKFTSKMACKVVDSAAGKDAMNKVVN